MRVANPFFLDCLRQDQLQQVVAVVGRCSAPGAWWLVSDFRVPKSGWRGLRARLILAGLDAFFRVLTRLPARELKNPDSLMAETGFELKRRRYFNFGMLLSEVWRLSEDLGTWKACLAAVVVPVRSSSDSAGFA